MTQINKINHVAIVVDDIQKSLAFWRDALGLEMTELRDVPAGQIMTIIEPNLKVAGKSPEGIRLDLTGRLGSSYDILTSSHVDVPPEGWALWQRVTSTSPVMTITDTNVSGAAQRFYRSRQP